MKVQKDGRVIRRNVPDALYALFDLANLDDGCKQVLRNFYLLRFVRMTVNEYRRMAGAGSADIDALNYLVELGYIQCSKENAELFFLLHPLIQTLIHDILIPGSENCKSVFNYIHTLIKNYGKSIL